MKSVNTVVILLFALGGLALAQQADEAAGELKQPATSDKATITLAVALAEYGIEQESELALITAADMFNQLNVVVMKRGKATEHKEGEEHEHPTDAAYDPSELLKSAAELAAEKPNDVQESLETLIEQVELRGQELGGSFRGIHTHWQCDYFGNCIWVTHCHSFCY